MSKRNFIFLLSVNLLLYLVSSVGATQNYAPRNVNIDRSDLPKNILVGCFIGGRSHLKPMLDVAVILAERGYNVKNLKHMLAYSY
jgi:hypothetical protein